MKVPPHERGAALLTVLLLVAVMATVSATALDRLTLATRLTANAAVAGQARQWLGMAEQLAAVKLEDALAASPDRTTLAGGWLNRAQAIDLPDGGRVVARVSDAGNCFNLNSLASRSADGVMIVRAPAVSQFSALMAAVGIDAGTAQRVAAAAADWIDSDNVPLPAGAEDSAYAGTGRVPANTSMADESELFGVSGMTAEVAALIRPWVCALPDHQMSPVNINTLTLEQAPLLTMLVPGQMTIEQARAVIAQRPTGGFDSVNAFWKSPVFRGMALPQEATEQVTVRSNWFRLQARVANADVAVGQIALLAVKDGKVRLVRRQWSQGE